MGVFEKAEAQEAPRRLRHAAQNRKHSNTTTHDNMQSAQRRITVAPGAAHHSRTRCGTNTTTQTTQTARKQQQPDSKKCASRSHQVRHVDREVKVQREEHAALGVEQERDLLREPGLHGVCVCVCVYVCCMRKSRRRRGSKVGVWMRLRSDCVAAARRRQLHNTQPHASLRWLFSPPLAPLPSSPGPLLCASRSHRVPDTVREVLVLLLAARREERRRDVARGARRVVELRGDEHARGRDLLCSCAYVHHRRKMNGHGRGGQPESLAVSLCWEIGGRFAVVCLKQKRWGNSKVLEPSGGAVSSLSSLAPPPLCRHFT